MDNTEDILWDIRKLGCELFIGEDGSVHGRMMPGMKMTIEGRKLVERLRMHESEALKLMREEKTETWPIDAIGKLSEVFWNRIQESGSVILGGPVVVDQKAGTMTIIYRQVKLGAEEESAT